MIPGQLALLKSSVINREIVKCQWLALSCATLLTQQIVGYLSEVREPDMLALQRRIVATDEATR